MGETPETVAVTFATLQGYFSDAFSTVSSNAMSILGVAIPIAIGIGGVVFVARKAMGWFKSMAK